MLPTIEWQADAVVMIDQRKLPGQEVYVRCKTANEVARAIKTMVIRGAPAIGVAAAMGIALGMQRSKAQGTRQFAVEFNKMCDLMAATRPTAVNLFWAIDRMKRAFAAQRPGRPVGGRDPRSRSSAKPTRFTTRTSRAAGRWAGSARRSCRQDARILTHCNAGALATAGYGTALGVIRAAAEQGKVTQVFADETRPFLQGARLTAWELVRDHVPTTVITESMAGPLMQRGDIDFVVVGADRIAANGDFANKIGTYTVAMMARRAQGPVLRRRAAVDDRSGDGRRATTSRSSSATPREMTHLGSTRLTPEGASVWNPAFDVTPARLVDRHHHGEGHRPRAVSDEPGAQSSGD